MNDYRFQRLKKKYDADSNANVARDNISNLSRNYNDFITNNDNQQQQQQNNQQINSKTSSKC